MRDIFATYEGPGCECAHDGLDLNAAHAAWGHLDAHACNYCKHDAMAYHIMPVNDHCFADIIFQKVGVLRGVRCFVAQRACSDEDGRASKHATELSGRNARLGRSGSFIV